MTAETHSRTLSDALQCVVSDDASCNSIAKTKSVYVYHSVRETITCKSA